MSRPTRSVLAALFAAAALTVAGEARAATIYLSQDSNANGLYSLDPVTGLATLIGAGITTVQFETVGLSMSNTPGVLFGSQWQGLLHINADGSGATQFGTLGMEGMEYADGVLYGAINGGFFTVNPATGAQVTTLASPGVDIEGLAAGNGVIYGLQGSSVGGLYAYNVALNAWSFIGATGVAFDQSGLAYNPILNVLYAVGQQDSNLYSINPAIGLATVIGSTGLLDPGGGLAFDAGPAAVPEPASLLLLGTGAAGLLAKARRRKQRNVQNV